MSAWRLTALLAIRAREEERAAMAHARACAAAAEAERALAAARSAAIEANEAMPALETGFDSIGGLLGRAHHRRRVEAALEASLARASAATADTARARTAHGAAHARRQALETLRQRWLEERRRRKAAADDLAIEEAAAARRRA